MRAKSTFHKVSALFICLAVFLSLMLTANALSARAVDNTNIKLVPTLGASGTFDIPESRPMSVQEMQSLTAQSQDSLISPFVIPDPSSIFQIEFMKVYPAVMVNGTIKYLDYYYTFRPSSSSRTTLNANMTAEKQKVLIDYAESKGYTVVGFYLAGEFYVQCYIPDWVEYKTYNHETPNGSSVRAAVVNNRYTSVSTFGLFPEDGSQVYTYGWDGNARMLIYHPETNRSEHIYPPFSMKVHFTN